MFVLGSAMRDGRGGRRLTEPPTRTWVSCDFLPLSVRRREAPVGRRRRRGASRSLSSAAFPRAQGRLGVACAPPKSPRAAQMKRRLTTAKQTDATWHYSDDRRQVLSAWAHSGMQGWRPSMEDAVVAVRLCPVPRQEPRHPHQQPSFRSPFFAGVH